MEKIVIDGVELTLMPSVKTDDEWIDYSQYLQQLQAAWLTLVETTVVKRTNVDFGARWFVCFCAGFSDAGMPMPSTCSGAGVREAPRHEIAGCGAAPVAAAIVSDVALRRE
jgi:hypothetical protein